MSTRNKVAYEVSVDLLQLTDTDGHRHFLTNGRDLPDWVQPDHVAALVKAGTVTRYEVI